jgi:hypothetical protein
MNFRIEQFLSMDFRPCLNQPALPSGQASGYQLDRFETHHC